MAPNPAMKPESPNPFALILRIGISLVLIAGFIAGGVQVFLLLRSFKKPPARTAIVQPRTAVRAVTLKRATYKERLTGYGLARALLATEISAEVTGIVQWVSPSLEAGKEIKRGDVLVRIDDGDLKQRVLSAEAAVKQVRAERKKLRIDLDNIQRKIKVAEEEIAASRRELDRLKQLKASGQVAASELDRQVMDTSLREGKRLSLEQQADVIQPAMEQATAEEALQEAQLELARRDLKRAIIAAPFGGRVERRLVQVGARVSPGTPLFSLVNLERIEVALTLGASHFGEVKVGAKAALRLREDAPVLWEGRVARISPTVDAEERTFKVYLEISGSGDQGLVPPGAFAIGTVEGAVHPDVLAVPRSAFVNDRVFVLERTGSESSEAIVHEKRPKILKLLPDVALVQAGLEEGQELVVTNVEEIAEGSRVSVIADAPLLAQPHRAGPSDRGQAE